MNYDHASIEELQQHSEALRAEAKKIKDQRLQVARAIEAKEAERQAMLDLERLGPERVKQMAQMLQARGVDAGTVGTPGAR